MAIDSIPIDLPPLACPGSGRPTSAEVITLRVESPRALMVIGESWKLELLSQ